MKASTDNKEGRAASGTGPHTARANVARSQTYDAVLLCSAPRAGWPRSF
jgi:hypothetical protein